MKTFVPVQLTRTHDIMELQKMPNYGQLIALFFSSRRAEVHRARQQQEDIKSFFFNDTAPTEIYPLSLHDALPIFGDHFQPIVGLLAPFFRVFPTPETLLVA